MRDADLQTGVLDQSSSTRKSVCFDESSRQKMRRQLSGDLDNIVLMALRKEPSRRYASVGQFAEDLRRHLDGLPVSAVRGSWSYRSGKFIRRHKVGIAAISLVLLAVAIGIVSTIREARIAAANQKRAEERFNDVRKLANSLIFEIHDSIENLPGATPARKLIVERALEYLGNLAREAQGDPSLQRELADAYKRIGDVQGGPFAANLGDTAGALKSYKNAMSIRESLLNSKGGNADDRIGLAQASRLAAAALSVSGETAGALEHTRRAVQTLEEALPSNASNLKLKRELMLDYGAEADVLASFLISSNLNSVSTALPLRRKQLELAEELDTQNGSTPETQRSLAQTLNLMGDELLLAGQRKEALQYYERALPMLDRMASGSTNTSLLLDLHDTYYRLLPVEVAEEQLDLAIKSGRRALATAQQISSADAQNTQARLILAADLSNLADALSRAGQTHEALNINTRALKVDAELSERFPKTPQFRHMKPARFQAAGDIYFRLADYAHAQRYYAQGIEILTGMRTEDPANTWTILRLATAYNGIAAVMIKTGDLPGAATSFKKAFELLSTEIGAQTPSEDALYGYADSAFGLGEVEHSIASSAADPSMQRAHFRQAILWYDTSITAWGRVREPGLVSPTGFNCVPLATVVDRRSRCLASLARAKNTDKATPQETAQR